MTGASSGNTATDSSRLASRATWNRNQRTRTGTVDPLVRCRHVMSEFATKFSWRVSTACTAFATTGVAPRCSNASNKWWPAIPTEAPTSKNSGTSRRIQ